MKKIIIILLVLFSFNSYSQISSLKIAETGSLKFYWTFNSMSNNNHPADFLRKLPYQSFGIEGDIYFFDVGKSRWNIACKAVDDLIWDAFHNFSKTAKEKHKDNKHAYYSITGLTWIRYTWNMKQINNFNLALGFSLSDYMWIMPGANAQGFYDGQPYKIEPHGWYWAIGPAVMIDYAITKDFSLHFQTNYDVSFLRLSKGSNTRNIDGYKKPFFSRSSLTLMTSLGIYAQFDYSLGFDRGEFGRNITRREFHIGYSFKIK